MDTLHCDILVVGGGPAGAAAARAAARQGAKVLLVERRTTVGVPVQCAEYIPAMLMGKINLGRRFVVQSIKCMKTYRPGCEETVTKAPGYIIRRDLFDQTLVQAAQDDGVQVLTATRAVERWASETVILKQKGGRYFKINPWIIIGADGPRSTVGNWVGAVNTHLLPGVQMTFALTQPLDHTEVHFHPEIYAGYGWLFPKGDFANVGLGLKRNGNTTGRIRKALDNFVACMKSQNKIKGDPVSHSSRMDSSRVGTKDLFMDALPLVGDAAGHTHPITGAGIFAAVIGGQMAGKWAGRAVKENDASLLSNYDEEWQDMMADTLARAHLRRCHMEQHWNNFSDTVQKCWVAYRDYYA